MGGESNSISTLQLENFRLLKKIEKNNPWRRRLCRCIPPHQPLTWDSGSGPGQLHSTSHKGWCQPWMTIECPVGGGNAKGCKLECWGLPGRCCISLSDPYHGII